MIAILAPGQGSQAPGMLSPWLELDGAEERLAGWSERAGLDLRKLGTTATAEEIVDTSVTQPLVVAAALLAQAEIEKRFTVPADTIVAGHSVGELAAAAVAGVLTADDAVGLASVRGREMAAACALHPTGMTAILGGEREVVLAKLAEYDVEPANQNGAGQIVAAGDTDALQRLAADLPAGVKSRALKVAGAFHTKYMAPAQDALRAYAGTVPTKDPVWTLLSNADGGQVTTGTETLTRLVDQVTRPVKWDACMATLGQRGVTVAVELPPAGALVGLIKRELPSVARIRLKTPADLDSLTEFVEGSK
ncbi:ACP S-malonyltransferase [Kibdelosporangium philippinense]|uniref:[acyl-carrier-protein] S-malonyltransferase n=2 Tax=Kibdelosporangium philippinense TaxID=211113 RepID=A0ABS8ZYE1_9PSEU|nr:ACP S-malonyltransferase [Kibdelosporangium philippinense]MCE7011891.1 ACP S-malonyltransferase [Kibdelosporangium philippinense]